MPVFPRPSWLRALFVGLLVVITVLALTPKPPTSLSLGWDKLNHGVAFAVLLLSGRSAWPDTRGRFWWVGLLGYGVGLELAQSLTVQRQAEWADVLADGVGVALGHLGWVVWRRWTAAA